MKRVWLIIIGDFVSFWFSLLIILYTRNNFVYNPTTVEQHLSPFLILYLFWTLIFYIFRLYDLFSIKPTIPHLRRFILALLMCFFVGIWLFYFAPIFGISPKTNLIFQTSIFGLFSFLLRRIFYGLYSTQITRPAILIGNTSYLEELHNTIKQNPQLGLKIIFYTQNFEETIKRYRGTKNAIFIIEGENNIISVDDMLIIYENKSEVLDITEAYERFLNKIPVGYISQSWIIENIKIKKDVGYRFISRIIDIIFSLFTFILTSPIFIISAILIYTEDKGPIFYIQKRVGLNGKVFNFYKLRSMIVSSEKNGAEWSSKNDPRITKVGKILRKLHVDELPQMINVLKGDMALIGVRPERPEFVSELEKSIPHYKLRHIVRPGFTGWAQIKYHYANTIDDSKEKFEYDLYYIKNRNLFLDFGIFLRTIQIIFTH